MNSAPPNYHNPEFDAYADGYDAALERGISVSGEKKDFFARGRIELLRKVLAQKHTTTGQILDFGCGTGSSTPHLFTLPGARKVVGVEVSGQSLKIAERLHGGGNACFRLIPEYSPNAEFDLAFCNGVFHHIPPDERASAIDYVFRALKPGGSFALWENNPWNIGTRIVMSRVPFDRDAVPLSVLETAQRLKLGGFTIASTQFAFYFPRALSWFRFLEPALTHVPFGAQYMVLATKPV